MPPASAGGQRRARLATLWARALYFFDLEVDGGASTTKNQIQTAPLEEFPNLRRNMFEHDGERFPGISSGSETIPCSRS